MSGLLFIVTMTVPVLLGIAIGHLALYAILGALETAVVKAAASPRLVVSETVPAAAFRNEERVDDRATLAA